MEKEEEIELSEENTGKNLLDRVGQEQIHSLLFVEKIGWKEIIHELINTEQLDPWDIDISLLTNRFLDKVKELEEANFFISSQVLLAASLLLRFKSDILLNQYIPELDAVLFGRKKEEKRYSQERIELDEEIPGLTLRTPLPRFRKVTLDELMKALGHAIKTENRRIRKVIVQRQQELETALSLPKHRINIKDRIKEVYSSLRKIFAKREEKLAFSEFSGKSNNDRISTFIPLLHLDNQHKVWLEQDGHLEEIWILLKHLYEQQNAETLETMKNEAESAIETLVSEEQAAMAEEEEAEVKNAMSSLTGFSNNKVDEFRQLENKEDEEESEDLAKTD
jgi:segregation and condensation protein A